MTFRSLFRITLIGGSLWACVNQYTSPGGEIENTSTEPSSKTSEEPSEATSSSSEARDTSDDDKRAPTTSDTSDDDKRAPTETSGACDDRTCVSATDCCKGYQCAFDPERSKVLRYCLPQ